MNAKILTLTNTEHGSIELPAQFREPVRPDLIRRAVNAIASNHRQPYGSHPEAGQRSSAKLSRRRRDFKASYGMGISRVPRKSLSRQGTRFNFVGAVAPGTRKGRQAHPPKAWKQWSRSINTKENRKAIRSAISATIDKILVAKRGHHAPPSYPFVLDNSAEQITKTKELIKALHTLGLTADLDRASTPKIQAGRATMRGRRFRTPRSVLLVVSTPCALTKSGHNVPGLDITPVTSLNAALLAPGGMPGRLTIFTQAAIEKLTKNNIFT